MPKRILIIGGGIIGLSTAWHCVQRGFDVTIVDRNPNHRDGCSFGNAGMVVPSHFVPLAAPGMVELGLKMMWKPDSPFYIKPRLSWDLLSWAWRFKQACSKTRAARAEPLLRDLQLASRKWYSDFETSLGEEFGLQENGLLMLCKSKHAYDEEMATAEKANKLGVQAEVLDAAETAERDPSISMDVMGSVFYPNDCHLSPSRLMAGLELALENEGCQFHWETEGECFAKKGDQIAGLKTSVGEMEADEYVICGGSWSPELAKELTVALPMQAGKGYSLTVEQPRELPRLCSILTEARVAVTPMAGTLRFGWTMEIAGLNDSISPRRVEGIIHSAVDYFPNFQRSDFDNVKPWVGLRPCSPDGLPFLGRSKKWKNVMISTGHAMMGISLAMVSGEIVANIFERGNETRFDMELLSPDRY